MPEWVQALIMFTSGIGLGLLCFVAGAWITFRVRREPGSGAGFLKDPKGDVFNVVDGIDPLPLDGGGPTMDEQAILKNTNRFLKTLGGE